MNTRKYPRTLQEAFGPYTSHYIEEKTEFDWQDKVVMAGSVVVGLIFLGVVLL